LLICNAARGLASGLARGLALAAAAVLNGLCNILGFNGLNSVHDSNLRFPWNLYRERISHTKHIISQLKNLVNRNHKKDDLFFAIDFVA
jgi:hypothetical protein